MKNFLATNIPDAPTGWCPLSKAFDWFALAALGPAWHPLFVDVDDKLAALSAGDEQSQSLDGKLHNGKVVIDLTSAIAAKAFIPRLCRSFASAVRAGRLRTGYATKGAGELQEMPAGAWRTDNPFIRFRGWGFDPQSAAATGEDLPCWVFVHADDFSLLRRELEEWRAALPEASVDAVPLGGDNFLCGTTLADDWPMPFFIMPGADSLYPFAALLPNFETVRSTKSAKPANDLGPPAKDTKPKPAWYPALRDLVDEQDKKLADFAIRHPGASLPVFPKEPWFRKKLVAKGFDESKLPRSTVSYHLRALKEEFGR